MKTLFNFLTSRLVIICLLIVVQVAVILIGVMILATNVVYLYGSLQLLSMVIIVWMVSKNENPSYKLAWVIAIFLVPVFGGLLYIIFGNKRMPKNLSVRMEKHVNAVTKYFDSDQDLEATLSQLDPQLGRQAAYIQNVSKFPISEGTSSEYCTLGEVKFQRLKEELVKAQRFIFMEYFIIEAGKMWDPILEILKQKAKEGVEVRVMYDDIGTIRTLPADYCQTLRNFGIRATVFNEFKPSLNSLMNYRDHRKICVIDGNVGFCGGINLADEYINAYVKHGHWKDTAVILKGEGVWNLTLMFLTLWDFNMDDDTEDYYRYRPTVTMPFDGYVGAFGDSPLDSVNASEHSYMNIINRATKYVYITTPYLILDNEMATALTIAAQSGVDIRIITPHIPDKWYVHAVTQAYYAALVDAGVRIYEYTPGFVHAKMYVSDDKIAVVGTANMDYRSFYLHFECGVVFYQSSIVDTVKEDILRTLEVCTEITPEKLAQVPLIMRFVRSLLRIFSPMM